MDIYIKLNSQVAGKDKIARLLQYSSRALWHYLKAFGVNPGTIGKLKSLEYNFSTFRKLLRFGKSVEVMYQAFHTIHLNDLTLKCSLTLSKIATALFLLGDHILWIGRSGLSTVNTPRWTDVSNRYWLLSILMNIWRDVYELQGILKTHGYSFATVSPENMDRITSILYNQHRDVLVDTTKNFCDVWIPLTALGYVKFKPGTIGILGVISSLAGIAAILSPRAKLTPS